MNWELWKTSSRNPIQSETFVAGGHFQKKVHRTLGIRFLWVAYVHCSVVCLFVGSVWSLFGVCLFGWLVGWLIVAATLATHCPFRRPVSWRAGRRRPFEALESCQCQGVLGRWSVVEHHGAVFGFDLTQQETKQDSDSR